MGITFLYFGKMSEQESLMSSTPLYSTPIRHSTNAAVEETPTASVRFLLAKGLACSTELWEEPMSFADTAEPCALFSALVVDLLRC